MEEMLLSLLLLLLLLLIPGRGDCALRGCGEPSGGCGFADDDEDESEDTAALGGGKGKESIAEPGPGWHLRGQPIPNLQLHEILPRPFL